MKILKNSLLALVLAGCGGQAGYGNADIVTTCGTSIWMVNDVAEWRAEDAQKVEDAFMRIAPTVQDPKFADPCSKFERASVYVQETESFSYSGVKVAGITHCDIRYMAVGNAHPFKSAYAHEMFHIVQGCPYDDLDVNPWHPQWTTLGIWQKIDQINAELQNGN